VAAGSSITGRRSSADLYSAKSAHSKNTACLFEPKRPDRSCTSSASSRGSYRESSGKSGVSRPSSDVGFGDAGYTTATDNATLHILSHEFFSRQSHLAGRCRGELGTRHKWLAYDYRHTQQTQGQHMRAVRGTPHTCVRTCGKLALTCFSSPFVRAPASDDASQSRFQSYQSTNYVPQASSLSSNAPTRVVS